MDNTRLWRIAGSAEFKARFRDGHPLIHANGGCEFYCASHISMLLTGANLDLTRAATPRDRHILSNRIAVYESWLEQVEWIYANQHKGYE
jgi:hypothetical protein